MNKWIAIKLGLLPLLLLSLSACETLPSSRGSGESETGWARSLIDVGRPSGHREVTELMEYHQRVNAMSATERETELRRLRADLDNTTCNSTLLHLAVAQLVESAENTENLLKPCFDEEERQPTGIEEFARFIDQLLTARREQVAAIGLMAEELEKRNRENLELRRQLDGLKAIERSLQGRDRRIPMDD
ncbi:hypothetical protein CAI21_01620 [Alkalilimnicola ehrlichii]|uniref:Lipoprotein n=1 Tax=Alkalilimnicola ehrlichii TaxID=351052 RepID=A0A3E0X4B0_9GAMM|nr:hypothetical protein [Alkalilimnicola ehrlichii]RFA31352.1 hypothetical protein CAI21_01620 [Alkalilimnicola ehrlichii]RFA39376.1 hypothetical protein CAL65_00790 [Alkalilimnicola ehrlichii]